MTILFRNNAVKPLVDSQATRSHEILPLDPKNDLKADISRGVPTACMNSQAELRSSSKLTITIVNAFARTLQCIRTFIFGEKDQAKSIDSKNIHLICTEIRDIAQDDDRNIGLFRGSPNFIKFKEFTLKAQTYNLTQSDIDSADSKIIGSVAKQALKELNLLNDMDPDILNTDNLEESAETVMSLIDRNIDSLSSDQQKSAYSLLGAFADVYAKASDDSTSHFNKKAIGICFAMALFSGKGLALDESSDTSLAIIKLCPHMLQKFHKKYNHDSNLSMSDNANFEMKNLASALEAKLQLKLYIVNTFEDFMLMKENKETAIFFDKEASYLPYIVTTPGSTLTQYYSSIEHAGQSLIEQHERSI